MLRQFIFCGTYCMFCIIARNGGQVFSTESGGCFCVVVAWAPASSVWHVFRFLPELACGLRMMRDVTVRRKAGEIPGKAPLGSKVRQRHFESTVNRYEAASAPASHELLACGPLGHAPRAGPVLPGRPAPGPAPLGPPGRAEASTARIRIPAHPPLCWGRSPAQNCDESHERGKRM